MRVGVVYDPVYLKHDTGTHPENASRLESIVTHLETTGTWNELIHISPRPASPEELKLAHSASLIREIEEMAAQGGGMVDPDTVVSKGSFKAALYAAGGVIGAVEAVASGSVSTAFALVRPPGHHATRTRAMGFCLFNNVAVAALYALTRLGLSRVFILDWDVHHGNGTQEIFEQDTRVCYASLHQWPYYPGTGRAGEKGAGNVINVPLPEGCGDAEYLKVIDGIISPVARRFNPQLILVSSGFDGHWADPLAAMKLTIHGYADLTQRALSLANELCSGRLVLTLEGGYNLAVLAGAGKAVFDVLLGKSEIQDELGQPSWHHPPDIGKLMSELKTIHGL
jgi:acetoin utilization deacetylase AcuC-like enzyme